MLSVNRPPMVRAALFLLLGGAALTLTSCGLRLYNKAGNEIADSAAELATELSGSEENPYATMEANMEAAFQENLKTIALTNDLDQSLFLGRLNQQTQAELKRRFKDILEGHVALGKRLAKSIDGMAGSIDDELNKKALIKQLLGESNGRDLQSVLGKVQKRLDFSERLLKYLVKAEVVSSDEPASPADGSPQAGAPAKSDEAKIKGMMGQISGVLKAGLDSKDAAQISQNMRQFSQDVIQHEMAMLLEQKRHMEALESLQEEFKKRDKDFNAKLASIVARRLFASELIAAYERANKNAELRKQDEQSEGIVPLNDFQTALIRSQGRDPLRNAGSTAMNIAKCQEAQNQKHWIKNVMVTMADGTEQSLETPATLGDYMASYLDPSYAVSDCWLDMQRRRIERGVAETDQAQREKLIEAKLQLKRQELTLNKREESAKMVAAMGLLMFVEYPKDLSIERHMALEKHRYSIRLYKVTGDFRLTLVDAVAQANKFYYAGGVKPEEISEMILLGTQAAAIGVLAVD